MSYQGMENAHDGMPLLQKKGSVEVVEEGGIDELNGSSMSRRSRKGAALGLVVLALGAVSALSSLGGRQSSQSEQQPRVVFGVVGGSTDTNKSRVISITLCSQGDETQLQTLP